MPVVTTHPFRVERNNRNIYSTSKYFTRVEYTSKVAYDESKMNDIYIITHDYRFHADEVVGIALLKAFLRRYTEVENINVVRVPHSNNKAELHKHLEELNIPHYSFVLDTGREFNGITYFDHHQEDIKDVKNPKATAGKILEAIVDWELNLFTYDIGVVNSTSIFTLPEFSSLARIVDENDLGISPAGPHTIPFIISHLQSVGFDTALLLMETYIESIINSKTGKQDLVNNIMSHTKYIEDTYFRVQYSDAIDEVNLDSWNRQVNQTDFNIPIHGIITYSKESKKWKLHTMSAKDGSYDKSGPSLPMDSSIDFVHTAGFIATDTDKDNLLNYIVKHFSKEKCNGV